MSENIQKTPLLLDIYPDLLKEWKYDKNGELLFIHVRPHIMKKVWWTCGKHGHVWCASFYGRSYGHVYPNWHKKYNIKGLL